MSPSSRRAVEAGARRRLVLCADDYALAPGVSKAILDLIAKGRLSATSCMTASRFWPEHAAWLRPLAGRADVGLHLTLTDQRPLTAAGRLTEDGRLPGIVRLTLRAYARRLDVGAVRRELDAQLDAFEASFGSPPQFIDGHQHVHQLPGVYPLVIEAMRRRLDRGRAWLRICCEPPGRLLRRRVATVQALVIAGLGLELRAAARRAGLRTNSGFSGVTRFDLKDDFAALFARFLAGAPDRSLIMCHPGWVDEALRRADPVTLRREDEYRYLAGDALPQTLARARVQLARLYTL